MIKKTALPVLFVTCIVLLVYFVFTLSGGNKSAGSVYGVSTFKSGDGWGYQINREDDVIIFQPYMPCVKGNKPFPDEKSAREVGDLVLLKLRTHGDPTVTMEELDKTIHICDY